MGKETTMKTAICTWFIAIALVFGIATSSLAGQHLVKKGDCLWRIAKNNGTTVSALMKLNPQIKNADLIYVGDTINIPGSQQAENGNGGMLRIIGNNTATKLGEPTNLLTRLNVYPYCTAKERKETITWSAKVGKAFDSIMAKAGIEPPASARKEAISVAVYSKPHGRGQLENDTETIMVDSKHGAVHRKVKFKDKKAHEYIYWNIPSMDILLGMMEECGNFFIIVRPIAPGSMIDITARSATPDQSRSDTSSPYAAEPSAETDITPAPDSGTPPITVTSDPVPVAETDEKESAEKISTQDSQPGEAITAENSASADNIDNGNAAPEAEPGYDPRFTHPPESARAEENPAETASSSEQPASQAQNAEVARPDSMTTGTGEKPAERPSAQTQASSREMVSTEVSGPAGPAKIKRVTVKKPIEAIPISDRLPSWDLDVGGDFLIPESDPGTTLKWYTQANLYFNQDQKRLYTERFGLTATLGGTQITDGGSDDPETNTWKNWHWLASGVYDVQEKSGWDLQVRAGIGQRRHSQTVDDLSQSDISNIVGFGIGTGSRFSNGQVIKEIRGGLGGAIDLADGGGSGSASFAEMKTEATLYETEKFKLGPRFTAGYDWLYDAASAHIGIWYGDTQGVVRMIAGYGYSDIDVGPRGQIINLGMEFRGNILTNGSAGNK